MRGKGRAREREREGGGGSGIEAIMAGCARACAPACVRACVRIFCARRGAGAQPDARAVVRGRRGGESVRLSLSFSRPLLRLRGVWEGGGG